MVPLLRRGARSRAAATRLARPSRRRRRASAPAAPAARLRGEARALRRALVEAARVGRSSCRRATAPSRSATSRRSRSASAQGAPADVRGVTYGANAADGEVRADRGSVHEAADGADRAHRRVELPRSAGMRSIPTRRHPKRGSPTRADAAAYYQAVSSLTCCVRSRRVLRRPDAGAHMDQEFVTSSLRAPVRGHRQRDRTCPAFMQQSGSISETRRSTRSTSGRATRLPARLRGPLVRRDSTTATGTRARPLLWWESERANSTARTSRSSPGRESRGGQIGRPRRRRAVGLSSDHLPTACRGASRSSRDSVRSACATCCRARRGRSRLRHSLSGVRSDAREHVRDAVRAPDASLRRRLGEIEGFFAPTGRGDVAGGVHLEITARTDRVSRWLGGGARGAARTIVRDALRSG